MFLASGNKGLQTMVDSLGQVFSEYGIKLMFRRTKTAYMF